MDSLQAVTAKTPTGAQNSNARVLKNPFKKELYSIDVEPFKTGGMNNPALIAMDMVLHSNSRQEELDKQIGILDKQIIEARENSDEKDLNANIAGKVMLGLAKTVADLAPEDKKDKVIGDILDPSRDNESNLKDIKDIKTNEPDNLVRYALNILRDLKYEPEGDKWTENYKNDMIRSSILQNMFIPIQE